MQLKSKQQDFAAEKVSSIVQAIKNNKAKDLPRAIFHAYQRGDIYIGVDSSILAHVNNQYIKVDSDKYLLVAAMGGIVSVVDNLYELQYLYDIQIQPDIQADNTTRPLALVGCPFQYCDTNPMCQGKCRYALP